jgi:hypothetical protein
MSATRLWCLCPRCRVFIDQTSEATARVMPASADVTCPWCSMRSTLGQWLEAGKRDLCECGCPRAAHAAYVTSDGEPPRGDMTQGTVIVAAPCIGCGCTQVAGDREIRVA